MREHLPVRLHMKPPTTTKLLGLSGQVLKQHLGCGSWAEVYTRFVVGNDEVPEIEIAVPTGGVGFPKRLNPETLEYFKKGEESDGRYFSHYLRKESNSIHSGYCREFWWACFEDFKKKQVNDAFSKSRKAASKRRNGEGLEWNISKEKQEELISVKNCPVCDVRMRMPWEGHPRKIRAPIRASFSIDRLDNEIGYIDSNVGPICHGCNTMKGTLSKQDILKFAEKMAAHVS